LDKSTIHIIDAESQFTSMHCPDSSDAIMHCSKIKTHLELMEREFQNLNVIGSTWDEAKYSQQILSSLPESYHLIVQMLSVQRDMTSKLPDLATLYKIIMNEVNHQVIHAEKGDTAMFTKDKSQKSKKPKLKFVGDCYGCREKGHKSIDCPKEKSGQSGSVRATSDKQE
jgi:hypothetical protein